VDEPGVTNSTRRGGALRVFLGAAWHSSGDGEQLALVGDPEWGFDPIHHAGSEGGGPLPDPKSIRVSGWQIYPFDVFYDKSAGLWYSDIVFRNGAYFPFVKLVLARYQPQSCPGRYLSPVVYAGFHQLLPDRVVSLTYAGGGSRVSLAITGPRPSGPNNRIKYAIVVGLEEREAAREDWDPDLGWQPAAAGQQPIPDPPGSDQLWRGHVVLTHSRDDRDRRLVIREFELFPKNDCDSGQETPGDVSPELAGFSPRLVYADTIPLKRL
jgi:hypothetical protein